MGNRIRDWLKEARRRRVFRTAGVYIVAIWGLSQGTAELGPLFGAPDWMLRAVVVVGFALLPVVVVLAWMFDIGRHGIVRDPVDADRLAARSGDGGGDEDLASMPTLLGANAEAGGVLVCWTDATGEGTALFTEDFLIGRGSECRVRYYDPLVSRRHARVRRDQGVWRIEDLGSRNGTWVGGERVEDAALASSNEIRVNEAGPVLDVRVLEPGPEIRSALEQHADGPTVAHVRDAGSSGLRARRTATLES